MTKKGRQLFGAKKCTPQTKSWLRLCKQIQPLSWIKTLNGPRVRGISPFL